MRYMRATYNFPRTRCQQCKCLRSKANMVNGVCGLCRKATEPVKKEKLPEVGKRYFVPGGKGELTLVVTYVNQREGEPTTVFMACENPADRTDRLGTPYRLDYFWRTQRKYSKPSLEN